MNANISTAKDFMALEARNCTLSFDEIICGYVLGLSNCLLNASPFKQNKTSLMEAANVAFKAMNVENHPIVNDAENKLLKNDPKIRIGYELANKDFEIFKNGYDMPMSIGRYIVFYQNEKAFEWNKNDPHTIMVELIKQADFITGTWDDITMDISDEDKQISAIVSLNIAYQVNEVLKAKPPRNLANTLPFDPWIAGFIWGLLLVKSGELEFLHSGLHESPTELVLNPDLEIYTYVCTYGENGWPYLKQFSDWQRTSRVQFESSVNAAIEYASGDKKPEKNISKPLQDYLNMHHL